MLQTFFSSITLVNDNDGGCTLFDSGFGIALVVVMVVLLLGALVLPLIRRRGKNSADDLHSNLAVGDKIMTVCGIIGTVLDVSVNSSGEKEITVCTGTESCSSHITVHISGIYKNFTKPPIQRDFFGRPKPGQVVPEKPSDGLDHDLAEPTVAGEESAVIEPFEQTPVEEASMAVETHVEETTVATVDEGLSKPVVEEKPAKTPAKRPTNKKK